MGKSADTTQITKQSTDNSVSRKTAVAVIGFGRDGGGRDRDGAVVAVGEEYGLTKSAAQRTGGGQTYEGRAHPQVGIIGTNEHTKTPSHEKRLEREPY